jgi:outer membrane protein assembly factor BamB
VRELVLRAGDPEDLSWALEEQLEKTWLRMQEFLQQASELGQRAQQLIEAGDWQQARTCALELLQKYEITKVARQVRLPVMIRTRPSGAALMQGGKPLMRKVGDRDEPLVTPCVVLCPVDAKASFAVDLEGFEPQGLLVSPRQQASVEVVLKVVPSRTVRFDSPVQTGVGVGNGKAAVGLRGGRVGFFQMLDGKLLGTVDFAGLRAVDSTPTVTGGRVFVLTNEGSVECLLLDSSSGMARWAVRVDAGPNTELLVRDGRVMLIDKQNRLLCLDQSDGRLLWNVPIDGHLSGPPTFERRQVRIGTLDGSVMLVDAGDGKVMNTFHAPAGLTTRVLASEGSMLFGCNDGTVRCIDDKDGRVQWTQSIGRTLVDGELLLTKAGLVVLGAEQQLQLLALTNGQQRAVVTLKGALQPGMLQVGKRVVVAMRLPKNGKQPTHDVLQAFDGEDFGVLWEYVDIGWFTGPVTTDGEHILLPDSNGDVVIFR